LKSRTLKKYFELNEFVLKKYTEAPAMVESLVNSDLLPEQILAAIRRMDTTTEIKKLIIRQRERTAHDSEVSQRAAIMKLTNTHTGTLTLHRNEKGNISLKAPDNAPASPLFYSVPGNSILFAINAQSFCVQLYQVENDTLIPAREMIVDADNPLFIDGSKVLYDSNPNGDGHPGFIGSLNFPDNSTDICVYDRRSLRKIAWFPHDASAARYLVSLELLESVQDPDAGKVAEELIYHYHPAVAWKAFQRLHGADPRTALGYVSHLRRLQNVRLDLLLDMHLEGAA
jgi:hypothetical protein